MSSVVINPKNASELKFFMESLQKLGVNSKVLTDEEQEDLGLYILMKEANRSNVVPESEVLGKLQG